MKIVATFAALALAAPLLAGPPPAFEERFVDATLRIDTFHTGNGSEEVVTLDNVNRQGMWAGSRTHLLEPFGFGGYLAKVVDPSSGTLLFSKGYDTYFGEYRTTPAAEKGVRRTYHESVLIPCPKGKVRFAIEARGRDGSLKEIFSTEIDPSAVTVLRKPLGRRGHGRGGGQERGPPQQGGRRDPRRGVHRAGGGEVPRRPRPLRQDLPRPGAVREPQGQLQHLRGVQAVPG